MIRIGCVKIVNVEGEANITHFYEVEENILSNAPDMSDAKDEILSIMKKYNILILDATQFRFNKKGNSDEFAKES